MKLNDQIKQVLIFHSIHYSSVLEVYHYLFAQDHSSKLWKDGELVFTDGTNDTILDKIDLSGYIKLANIFPNDHFIKASILKKQFINDHMDDLCCNDTDFTDPFFTHFNGLLPFMELDQVNYYAPIFNYPDDLKPDWALGMYNFTVHWLRSLHKKYKKYENLTLDWNSQAQYEYLSYRLSAIADDLLDKSRIT